jgi:AhpD family alkylhydroperoxidase
MSFEDDLEIVLKKGVDKTAKDMLEAMEAIYGEVPYIFHFMEDQPELLVTKILHNNAILRSSQALDPKTIELISIAVAAAIRCTHCLRLHLRIAKRMEISDDEIAATLLTAGNIANATVLAMATRELNEKRDLDENQEVCKVCQVSNGEPMDV